MSLHFTLSVLSNIQAGTERVQFSAATRLYFQQVSPYNQVIYISNDVVVASVAMVPFISSLIQSPLYLSLACILKYLREVCG